MRFCVAEERAQRARVDDGARQQVRPDLLALLEHRERHLAEPLAERRLRLEQLSEPDRAREAGRSRADDQDADVDALVRRIARLRDDLAPGERRRIVRGLDAHDLRCFTSSRQLRDDLVQVADDAEIGELEDRRVAVLVDRDDRPGALHADLVLDRAGDADGDVQLRRHASSPSGRPASRTGTSPRPRPRASRRRHRRAPARAPRRA